MIQGHQVEPSKTVFVLDAEHLYLTILILHIVVIVGGSGTKREEILITESQMGNATLVASLRRLPKLSHFAFLA